MGPLGTHTSICLPFRPQPRKAEPHSFREKAFRKKAPVCAVCKITIDGTGVSCRGEVPFSPALSPPLSAPTALAPGAGRLTGQKQVPSLTSTRDKGFPSSSPPLILDQNLWPFPLTQEQNLLLPCPAHNSSSLVLSPRVGFQGLRKRRMATFTAPISPC